MEVNLLAVLAATVTMFAIGSVWYMVLFAKLWGKIHGFDKLDKKAQAQLEKDTGPYYALQVVVTIFSAVVLSHLIKILPNESPYSIAAWVWFGFAMPATVSSVIFGGTEPKWIPKKIAIQISETLLHLLAAAWVINLIQK
jgi:Protein of unknown function (DUF1761)